MSARKSKYQDETRYEDKHHKKSDNRKRESLEDSLQYKSKKKRVDYDTKDERKNDEKRLELNRKNEEKYTMDKSLSPESVDKYEHKRKSKKKKHNKNERLNKENGYYSTNYDMNEKANYDKDHMMSNDDDHEKETERKQKKNDDRLYQKDKFDAGHHRKRDGEKDNSVETDQHRSKHGKQSRSNKKHSLDRFSSDEGTETSRNRSDYSNQIRSSVHKIRNKTGNESTNDDQTDTDNSDNYHDGARTDTTKYKSKPYLAETDIRKKHRKQYLDKYNDAVERSDQDRPKSDQIRSSVHKIENKSRNKRSDDEQGNIEDDNYPSSSRNDPSKYKSRRYDDEKERGRQSDKFSEEYSYKRKRDSRSDIKRPDARTDRDAEDQRYARRDERISPSEEKLESKDQASTVTDAAEPLSKRQKIGNINMRTGGAYIPPARLRMMQESIKDKGSEEYQRIAWEALKKSIVGMTNKVNSSNITEIIPELFKENIIRGRGVLARAIMQAQAASPTFTRVYSALVAIINTKFPEIGELILSRLIIQYKRGFRRNDKTICMTAARFLAQLLNQEVAHEVLILEIVTHLLENPTEDSVEIAIATLKECGKKLTQLTPKGMRAITQRVRDVLHEASIDMRVRYMIEVFFAVQKDGFKDFEVIPQELDLVEEDDKYTHLINLNEAVDAQEMLNVFKFDPNYLENEEKYKSVVNEILGDSSDESGNESDDESEEDEEKEENADGPDQKILDMTETNLVCLRRKIYLTIQSSLDFEECAHKLLKLELKPGQILEMCYMILDCCAQQRTYEKFYGLLAQRFCQLNKIYVEPFTEIFNNSYTTIHRLETNKLRNVAKFFAHLLYTDAISWNVLSIIKLNEDDTTSSSRIFIKILFQELCEYMGLPKLNERVKDVTLQEAFEGLFPRDHPHNTRFAINFFTSIGLGGLTDELREHLKNLPKVPPPITPIIPDDIHVPSPSPQSDSSSSDSEESSTSSSSTSSSSTSDTDSSKDNALKKKKLSQKRKK